MGAKYHREKDQGGSELVNNRIIPFIRDAVQICSASRVAGPGINIQMEEHPIRSAFSNASETHSMSHQQQILGARSRSMKQVLYDIHLHRRHHA